MNKASDTPIARFCNDWFAVQRVREHIFAVSEPRYYQNNFSYLVVGNELALLIDSGASLDHDISRVVEALTSKPYAVLPTHLHFDHLGGLTRFKEIWLADIPVLNEFKQTDGQYQVPLSYTFGGSEGFHLPPFTPSRLVKPNEIIDLGGVRLEIILAPGHTPDELVVFAPQENILFTGDYLYPARLYCGDLPAYAESTRRLLAIADAGTLFLGSHPHKDAPEDLPLTDINDLRDLNAFFIARANNTAVLSPEPLNRQRFQTAKHYLVNERISFLEDIIWADGTPYTTR